MLVTPSALVSGCVPCVSSFELSAQWTSSPFESFLSAVDVRAFNA